MHGPGYGAFLVYFLMSLIISPTVCALAWLTRAQAKSRRLLPYMAWLTPLAISATLVFASIAVYSFATIFHFRSGSLAFLTYGLAALASPLSLLSAYRLWKMVRALPPYRGELPPVGGQETEGVWPPPPTR